MSRKEKKIKESYNEFLDSEGIIEVKKVKGKEHCALKVMGTQSTIMMMVAKLLEELRRAGTSSDNLVKLVALVEAYLRTGDSDESK